MTKRVILVLEDSEHRISWLQCSLPEAEIVWAKDVATFERHLGRSDIGVILLDHDLGDPGPDADDTLVMTSTWPYDVSGRTGRDAVPLLGDAHKETPIIIWSMNTIAAERMAADLAARGFACVRLPYGEHNYTVLKRTIGLALA